MSDRSAFALALDLAEDKYKDDKLIKSIFTNFNTKFTHFKLIHRTSYYDPLTPYLKALSGEEGYSLRLGDDTITSMLNDPVKRLIDLAVIQAIGEQLIFALQALGEDIDY